MVSTGLRNIQLWNRRWRGIDFVLYGTFSAALLITYVYCDVAADIVMIVVRSYVSLHVYIQPWHGNNIAMTSTLALVTGKSRFRMAHKKCARLRDSVWSCIRYLHAVNTCADALNSLNSKRTMCWVST